MSATSDHLGDMLAEQSLVESRAAAQYMCDIDADNRTCWSANNMEEAFRAGIAWHRKMLHTKAVRVTLDTDKVREAVTKVRDKITGLGQTSSNVTVDRAYHWLPMHTCPVNSKVQLLGKGGLPSYGQWDGKDDFYVGWAPIPTRSPQHEQQGFA